MFTDNTTTDEAEEKVGLPEQGTHIRARTGARTHTRIRLHRDRGVHSTIMFGFGILIYVTIDRESSFARCRFIYHSFLLNYIIDSCYKRRQLFVFILFLVCFFVYVL